MNISGSLAGRVLETTGDQGAIVNAGRTPRFLSEL